MTHQDHGEDGAVATEYVLVLTLIAVALVATLLAFGGTLVDAWTAAAADVNAGLTG